MSIQFPGTPTGQHEAARGLNETPKPGPQGMRSCQATYVFPRLNDAQRELVMLAAVHTSDRLTNTHTKDDSFHDVSAALLLAAWTANYQAGRTETFESFVQTTLEKASALASITGRVAGALGLV